MLRIVTGPSHPDLERALVEEVRRLKETDPLAPLAIVVPSKLLLNRLRRLLVVEAELSLLNVHFLTFHRLALRLAQEGTVRSACDGVSDGPPPMLPVEDLFFEHLLRQLVRRPLPGVELLRQFGQTAGAWPALWATLRDLKDAAVDPAVVLRAVGEGLFEAEEAPKLQALMTLYAALLESRRVLGVGSADDVAVAATSLAAASPFLSQLRRLCYYGFYDLTQVQLSFFEAVASKADATMYFNLLDDKTFSFARHFYERHVLPLGPASVAARSGTAARERLQVRVVNAVGTDDELAVCCKEILTLVETNGYRFDEIGVVARTLEPYQTSLRRLFDRHRIPFTTTAAVPAIQEPAVKVLLQLASLPLTGLYQAPVMEVLASPYYKVGRAESGDVVPRPDLWKLAVRVLGITRGEEEWQRLEAAGREGLWVGEREGAEGAKGAEDGGGRLKIDAAQLRLLWRLVSGLMADCRQFPERGEFAELTEAFVSFASKHLAVPGLAPDWREEDESSDRFKRLGAAIRHAVEQLRLLDRIGAEASWPEWAALFNQVIERATVPVADDDYPGVQVLDAMAARGLPFRALFLLGLNEKVFPRFIREDAFLRDRHRRVLEETLGYKIDEKLAGYDEEQLLFAMLCQAAAQRLYLLYQRADAEGRPLVPSPYLDQAAVRPAGGEVELVPRRFSERVGTAPFLPTLLTREELAFWLVCQGHDPSSLWAPGDGPERAELFHNGWEALRRLEGEATQPGASDGITGRLARYWEPAVKRGFAPTSLERYARCPFQYFAAQVLRLEPLRQPASEELEAQTMGELCHAVLRTCYPRLVQAGWPGSNPAASVQEHVRRAVEEVFAAREAKQGTGYALIWDLARETIERLVLELLEVDGEDCRASGFRPVAVEMEAQGQLEGLPAFRTVTIKGRLDRVDRRETPPALRIVDYKYKQSRRSKGEDSDLLTAAVRASRLQPPLYALMKVQARALERRPVQDEQAQPVPVARVEFLFLAPRWDNRIERASFDAATWQGPVGLQIKQTLTALLDGIKEGQFHILPDGYCTYCEFSAACRRFHGPTWWRAHRSPSAQRLRQLRKQKAKKDE